MARKKLPARDRRGMTDCQLTPSACSMASITTAEPCTHEGQLRFTVDAVHTGAWDLGPVDPMTFRSREQNRISGRTILSPLRTSSVFIEQALPEDPAAAASVLPQDNGMKVSL